MKLAIRPTLSTFLVLFFFVILLFLGLFAEVFESENQEVDLAQIYANPIPVNDLQHLKSLRITNKQGSFLLENTGADGNLKGPWQMIEPQSLKVKNDVISKIIDALNVIRVRNFHKLEPINISSFSLDNPTLTLVFTTSADKIFEIKMGLINPIDNSAYLSLSSQDQIYQIDPIEMALESYDLAQLVESKILALNSSSLASIEIYGQNGLDLKILKKEQEWVDQNGTTLAGAKVNRFFENLEDVKSSSILDKLTPEQIELMKKSVATPIYTLKLISNQGVRNYLIGQINGQIPGINIPEDSYVLSSDEKNSFIIIGREQLRIFGTKSSDLK
ncbi:MAG: DUF4340 domain-containing protein [Bacteriovoracaceae bacterium]